MECGICRREVERRGLVGREGKVNMVLVLQYSKAARLLEQESEWRREGRMRYVKVNGSLRQLTRRTAQSIRD